MRLSSELAACQMSILAEKEDFLSGILQIPLQGSKKTTGASVFMQVFAPNPRPAKCVRNPLGNGPLALEVTPS